MKLKLLRVGQLGSKEENSTRGTYNLEPADPEWPRTLGGAAGSDETLLDIAKYL
jgi:hypothetical protein